MFEVELKVRADHDGVREALVARDADRVGHVRQVDTYYDAPHREFAETDEALRIRRETDDEDGDDHNGDSDNHDMDGDDSTTKLTYKGPLLEAESKSREEHETVVDDGEAMAGVLSGLGFHPAATVEKEREYYTVGEYSLTLDSVDGLGEFVEIDREVGREADIEAAREDAAALLRDLGLDPEDQIRTSYLGLLLESEADSAGSGDE